MPMIDPMMAPYMQQAFGGGQLNERDMRSIMQGGGLLGQSMTGGGGGMGLGGAQPAPISQGPAPIQHNGPQQGPTLLEKGMTMGMLGGGGAGK